MCRSSLAPRIGLCKIHAVLSYRLCAYLRDALCACAGCPNGGTFCIYRAWRCGHRPLRNSIGKRSVGAGVPDGPRPALYLTSCEQQCHCEGALRPWQSREGTSSSYKVPIKTYQPIASVAALSERLWQLQVGLHHRRPRNVRRFVIARALCARGNLAVPGWITGKPSAKLRLPARDCHGRKAPSQ